MSTVLKSLTDHLDEMLAVGSGVVVTDVIGDNVSAFIGQWVPAEWLDAVTEILIGIGIFIGGELLAPYEYKSYVRLAAFGAVGVGVADGVSVALGLGASSRSRSRSASESEGSKAGGELNINFT